jgi:hypothetical protein
MQIYLLKPSDNSKSKEQKGGSMSRLIAKQFGVSSKAIRDIWNHRTWKFITVPEERPNQDILKSLPVKKTQVGIYLSICIAYFDLILL